MGKQRRLEDIKLIAEECGENVANILVEKFGGMRVYIPCFRYIERELKHNYIIRRFDGHNHRELAEKTGYSLRTVYEVIKKS